ncbi:MAG: hypothetical protein BMS9Abin28_0886 [Anaerolineae bacterium]|nr:MAG: hypothetical protein BMS9Abin28_0886 [Anaerolineae bacterium]
MRTIQLAIGLMRVLAAGELLRFIPTEGGTRILELYSKPQGSIIAR